MGKLRPDKSLFHIENFFCDFRLLLIPLWLFLYSYSLFFQTLGSLVWSGHKYVLFGWQGRSPRSIHRALWQGTIHNWGLKIYVRTIYLNYFVIFVNSHYLVNYRPYLRSKLSVSHFFLRIENICIILLWDFLTFIHYCDQIGCFKSTLSLLPVYQIY